MACNGRQAFSSCEGLEHGFKSQVTCKNLIKEKILIHPYIFFHNSYLPLNQDSIFGHFFKRKKKLETILN